MAVYPCFVLIVSIAQSVELVLCVVDGSLYNLDLLREDPSVLQSPSIHVDRGKDMLAKFLVQIREKAVASHAIILQSSVFNTQQNLQFALPTYTNLFPIADAKESPPPQG